MINNFTATAIIYDPSLSLVDLSRFILIPAALLFEYSSGNSTQQGEYEHVSKPAGNS